MTVVSAGEPPGIYGLESGSPPPSCHGLSTWVLLLESQLMPAEEGGALRGDRKEQRRGSSRKGEWQSKYWSDALVFVQRPSLWKQRFHLENTRHYAQSLRTVAGPDDDSRDAPFLGKLLELKSAALRWAADCCDPLCKAEAQSSPFCLAFLLGLLTGVLRV